MWSPMFDRIYRSKTGLRSREGYKVHSMPSVQLRNLAAASRKLRARVEKQSQRQFANHLLSRGCPFTFRIGALGHSAVRGGYSFLQHPLDGLPSNSSLPREEKPLQEASKAADVYQPEPSPKLTTFRAPLKVQYHPYAHFAD